jgi:predicted nicotinamide N-methyase/predicted nucleic acid-binding protein
VAAAYSGYFADSSALVKRYVQETGTSWVRRLTRRSPSTVVYIAHITAVEVISAVARRRKGRTLTAAKASPILHRFRRHLAGRYTVIEITPALFNEAMRLANTHALRAYDAVQLAAALEINRKEQDAGFSPVTLISADQALNDAATAERLTVDDPRAHPWPPVDRPLACLTRRERQYGDPRSREAGKWRRNEDNPAVTRPGTHRQPRSGRADRDPVPTVGIAGRPAACRGECPNVAPPRRRLGGLDPARKMPIDHRAAADAPDPSGSDRIGAAWFHRNPGPRMSATTTPAQVLSTTAGDFPLHEYRLRQAGREWTILHTGAVLTRDDEARLLGETVNRLPYGVALWPSAIALAHEVATRAPAFHGRRVLELGAGTGLPGIVAASLGGRVVQTDRDELALSVCRRNGERNGNPAIEHRLADWTTWDDNGTYDWIVGSDILYGESLHPQLRRIFETSLTPGGRVLLSDPFRSTSLRLLEALESDGWTIVMNKWDVGQETTPRPIGVFELAPVR